MPEQVKSFSAAQQQRDISFPVETFSPGSHLRMHLPGCIYTPQLCMARRPSKPSMWHCAPPLQDRRSQQMAEETGLDSLIHQTGLMTCLCGKSWFYDPDLQFPFLAMAESSSVPPLPGTPQFRVVSRWLLIHGPNTKFTKCNSNVAVYFSGYLNKSHICSSKTSERRPQPFPLVNFLFEIMQRGWI